MQTNVNENYKTLKFVDKDIKFITKSVIRIKILKSLEKTSHTIKEIVNETGICYSSISANLNKLEEKSYIVKKDNRFWIKPLTSIYLNNLLEFNDSLKLIDKLESLWNHHNIEELDTTSITDVILLSNSEIIESTPTDIYKTHNHLKEQILNSKKIKLIFPYLHPEYSQLIERALEQGADINLIIDNAVYNELYYKISKEERRKDNFIVSISSEIPHIYLTICDDEMNLGLFKNDGSFDQNRILISKNENAVLWADNLFEKIETKIREA